MPTDNRNPTTCTVSRSAAANIAKTKPSRRLSTICTPNISGKTNNANWNRWLGAYTAATTNNKGMYTTRLARTARATNKTGGKGFF